MDQRGFVVHHAHAPTATATSGLDDDRVAHRFGDASNLCGVVWQFAFRAWHTRHTGFDHGLLGRHLVAHHADGLGCGANEHKTAFLNPLGKVGVFAEETIPRVNGLGVRYFSGRNDGRHVQIAQGRSCRSNANSLFGQFDVLGFAVRLGIHHHSFNTQLFASPLDAQRDFASVGDQNLFKHAARSVNDEHGLAVFHGLAVVDQDFGDRATVVSFDFVEDLHGLDDANGVTGFDHAAHLHKGFGLGAGSTVKRADHG